MSLYTMPAGIYYIGDPCYVFDKATWKAYCDVGPGIVHTFLDHKCLSFYTKHGDGKYYDNEGFEYFVDSGTLGMIPIDIISCDKKKAKNHGRVVRIPVQILVRVSKNESVFGFGGIVIDTDRDE